VPRRAATDELKEHNLIDRRSILIWYLLSFVTLGIAWFVWYYKMNADAKHLALRHADTETRARGWSPGMSIVAVTLGSFIIVPPFVSVWGTWSRVREGTRSHSMAAGKQFLFCFVPLINIAYSGVLQSQLNHAATEEVPATVSATAQP
jgi:Domain of unknown function (DUF4234)